MESIWTRPDPLLLASMSPARRMLLESAGLPVLTESPDVDERGIEIEALKDGADPVEIAPRLAAAKALAVSRRRPGRVVIGGDQTLALDGRIFHKPADRAEAEHQLAILSGRTHTLQSAAAVARDGMVVHAVADQAVLTMRPLPGEGIRRYLALAGERATQSVGAYQLEGLGIHLFEDIRGDHSTILGLPLRPLLKALRLMGCLAF